MPFGLRNTPATFQRNMGIILSSVMWQFALIYLNDIAVFSKTPEDHIEHTGKVLTLLRDFGVTLKLNKCAFFTN